MIENWTFCRFGILSPDLNRIFRRLCIKSTWEGTLPETSLDPMSYLLKTEPSTYSFEDLQRDGETIWDGISNPQALLNLRSMKKGEKLVIYHSNTGKDAVGTATVVSVDDSNPKDPKVRIKAGKPIKTPRTLAEMREAPIFKDSILFRQFRLSVVPLTDAQYDWLTGA
jgi:predicted RNA-binding protein with PUA-like domain